MPDDMRFDAHRIYCDEAYHALVSVDLARQVEQRTAIKRYEPGEPNFARTLSLVKAAVPQSLATLVDFCAGVVSETLISGTLSEIPADDSVAPSIRHVIADHAADERLHHAYFTKAFELIWPQLDISTRRRLGPLFADFIVGFLMPDEDIEAGIMRASGLTTGQVARIVLESRRVDKAKASVRHAGRCTLRLLERLGVLDYGPVRDVFVSRELLV